MSLALCLMWLRLSPSAPVHAQQTLDVKATTPIRKHDRDARRREALMPSMRQNTCRRVSILLSEIPIRSGAYGPTVKEALGPSACRKEGTSWSSRIAGRLDV